MHPAVENDFRDAVLTQSRNT